MEPEDADFFDIGEYLTPGQTYTFKETKAPKGYRLLKTTFTLEVSAANDVTYNGKNVKKIPIPNVAEKTPTDSDESKPGNKTDSSESKPDSSGSGSGKSNSSGGSSGGKSSGGNVSHSTSSVRTGDDTNAALPAATAAIALLAIALVLLEEKKRRKNAGGNGSR